MDQQTVREILLSELPAPTEQQEQAIFADEAEYLLRAAPGSGKTWTACRRFIWRSCNWPHVAGGIALLSFTNVAVREFVSATAKLGQIRLLSDPNYVGTFDAFVERFLLGPFGHLLSGAAVRPRLFQHPRPGDRNNAKLKCWETIGGKKMPVYAWDIVPTPEGDGVVFRGPNDLGGCILGNDRAQAALGEFMKQGRYTHVQRAYWAHILLKQRPHIARVLAGRFPELIVDEAQDTSVWLLELLHTLRKHGTNVTLVGDPDQCIYSFAMADAAMLRELRTRWQIPERSLDKSFRCNNPIAASIRKIGTNSAFAGRGDPGSAHRRAFVVSCSKDDFSDSITRFRACLTNAGIPERESAMVCRANDHLQSVRGQVNFASLTGNTRKLAEAAFNRDCRGDFHEAVQRVDAVLREILWTDDHWDRLDAVPESAASLDYRLSVWKFVKSTDGLPKVSLNGEEWVNTMKERLATLIAALGAPPVPNLGQKIRRNGLKGAQVSLPLFEEQKRFPSIRQETIHKVKGESIGAVLVLGGVKFWNSVVNSVSAGRECEDRRLAYVAMSRAKDLMVVSLPESHFKKHCKRWIEWGFEVLS